MNPAIITYGDETYLVYGFNPNSLHFVIPPFLKIGESVVIRIDNGESIQYQTATHDTSEIAEFIIKAAQNAGYSLMVVEGKGLFSWTQEHFDRLITTGSPPFWIVNDPYQ